MTNHLLKFLNQKLPSNLMEVAIEQERLAYCGIINYHNFANNIQLDMTYKNLTHS